MVDPIVVPLGHLRASIWDSSDQVPTHSDSMTEVEAPARLILGHHLKVRLMHSTVYVLSSRGGELITS